MKRGRLGLWDTGRKADPEILCDRCLDRLDRDGEVPAAELLERGGWLLDERCDLCGCRESGPSLDEQAIAQDALS